MNAEKSRHLLLDDYGNESECFDDSCDDSEVDELETRLSDSDADEDSETFSPLLSPTQELFFDHLPNSFTAPRCPPTRPLIQRSETIEMIDESLDIPRSVLILGRQNKKKTNEAFSWFTVPDSKYFENFEFSASVNDLIANQTSIDYFFKLIISQNMIEEIVANTNKRIKLIDVTQIDNAKYKSQKERLLKHDLTSTELYAFIGVMILLGITKKSKVPIEELWL